MPKGPPVHEIFNQPMPGRDANFQHDKKETKEQVTYSSKKSAAPPPPGPGMGMKKFGGYKPKILGGGGSDLIPVIAENRKTTPAPKPPQGPLPVLTKPKPFVIGDKDIPMVLSTAQDASDDEGDNIHSRVDDMHIYEEPTLFQKNGDVRHEINNNDFNNNEHIYSKRIIPDDQKNKDNPYSRRNGINNESIHNDRNTTHTHLPPSDQGAFTAPNDTDTLIDSSHNQTDPTTFATDNPVFNNGEVNDNITRLDINTEENHIESGSEPDGVFIPQPDYEEDEKTMDFTGEDPDELLEERQQHQQQQLQLQQRRQQQQRQDPNVRLKFYEGEDFSQYLSDDDDDQEALQMAMPNKKSANARLHQKHSMFKIKENTFSGRKSKKKQMPATNSVRSFSFADSKYSGTKGKSDKKKMAFTEFSGDHDSFLNTSQQGEGYERFLNSKHGVHMEATIRGNADFPNEKPRDGNIWKKLTVRLRNKMPGSTRTDLNF